MNEILEEGQYFDCDDFCGQSFDNDRVKVVSKIQPKYKNYPYNYVFKCSVCEKDPELFGDGHFLSNKNHIIKGIKSCGCGAVYHWSPEQYFIRCTRKAELAHLKFLGFDGQWKRHKTKIKIECRLHGVVSISTINAFLTKSPGCPRCNDKQRAINSRIPEQAYVERFMATGAYHEDTQIWKNYRKTKSGYYDYWSFFCPICFEVADALVANLDMGSYPCSCSNVNQKQGYIQLIKDCDIILGIKYGIGSSAKNRLKQVSKKTNLEVSLLNIYQFPDPWSCQSAESYCKARFISGILDRRDFGDGWTETTFAYNFEAVKNVYEDHGGLIVYQADMEGVVDFDMTEYTYVPRNKLKKPA